MFPFCRAMGTLWGFGHFLWRRERVMDRLQAVYEEGSVVPIPFLRAADAVPMALLDDIRTPYLGPDIYAPPLVSLTARAPPLSLLSAAVPRARGSRAGPRHASPVGGSGVATGGCGAGGGGGCALTQCGLQRREQQAGARPTALQRAPLLCSARLLSCGLWEQVALAVIKHVAGQPCLLNLSRTLAFHKRTLKEEPLTLSEAEQQQHLVNDISDTLRTILCL